MMMLHFQFWPLPEIQTQRLLLRQLLTKDADAFFLLRCNEKVNQFMKRRPAQSLEETEEIIFNINEGITNKQWLYWAIVLQENKKLIGTITLWQFSDEGNNAEIGFELHPDFQHKGYMQEAVAAVTAFAFKQMQLKKLYAWTHRNNIASIKLLKKNNFKRDEAAEQEHAESVLAKNMAIYFLLNMDD